MESSCVRQGLFFFNCLFLLFGLVLTSLGLFANFDPAFVHRLVTFVDGIDDVFVPPPPPSTASSTSSSTSSSSSNDDDDDVRAVATYVRLMSHGVIALGVAVTCVALTGCCGAWRQSKRCLGLFFTLLLLCLLLTLTLGGALFFVAVAAGEQRQLQQPSSTSTTSSRPDPVVAKIAAGFKSLVEMAWRALTDGQRIAFERAHSCCRLYDPKDLLGIFGRPDCGSQDAVESRGCFDAVVDGIKRNFAIFGGATLLLAVVEITAMSMSCVLFQRIRKTNFQAV